MSKLIIIEGLDNTGKSTLINRLSSLLNKIKVNTKIKIIHLTKPPKDLKDMSYSDYAHKYYDDLIKEISLYKYDNYDYIILDRAWLSEYVYGYLYRNREKLELVEDILLYDYKVLELFTKDDVYLYTLYADVNFLQNNDDNNSLSNNNIDLIYKETVLFKNAFNASIIYNKHMICVNNEDKFIDILPVVFMNIIKDVVKINI